METKRCPSCQKLARATAKTCSRCGHLFEGSTGTRAEPAAIYFNDKSHAGIKKSGQLARSGLRARSIPPASPHRAGHYAGLHPEDQPYQSALIPVPRTLALEAEMQALPEEDIEPPYVSKVQTRIAGPPPGETKPGLKAPALPRKPRKMKGSRRPWRHGRFMPLLLTICCLFLLIGTTLLAYAFINKRPAASSPVLTASPNVVRVHDTVKLSGSGFEIDDLIRFKYDNDQTLYDGNNRPLQLRSDDLGTFSILFVVPADWSVGPHSIYAIDIEKGQSLSVVTTITVEQSSLAPPLLELSTQHLDFGAAAPGVVSRQDITLINAGGRKVEWQASSDQPWLAISPNSGAFYGRGLATVVANRTQAPGSYRAHITFLQLGKNRYSRVLTVTMSIKPAPPASLTVSPVVLTYQGSQSQNPPAQALKLLNASNQPVNWSSTVITGNGMNWLSISPASARLAAHSSQTIMVSVDSQLLAPGLYDGTIGFKGGTNPVVAVTLSVVTPGNLIASPSSLSFSSSGQNPPAQAITIQNSGGETLAWSVTASTSDGGNWLIPSPASGALGPNATTSVSVGINVAGHAPGLYQGMLTFSSNGSARQIPVSLTVIAPPTPTIQLNQSTLSFSTIAGTNPPPQSFTVTDTGKAPLHWVATVAQGGSSMISLSPTSGSLNPGQSATVTVTPTVSQAGAGTLSTSITIGDSDAGIKVASQVVNVTIVVKSQAMISLSPSTMDFSGTAAIPISSQVLVITNSGSQPLDWTIQSSQPWLTADVTSGSIPAGQNTVVNMQADSTSLSPGTYSATLTVSDSDAGTTVAPQTVTVTLTVS